MRISNQQQKLILSLLQNMNHVSIVDCTTFIDNEHITISNTISFAQKLRDGHEIRVCRCYSSLQIIYSRIRLSQENFIPVCEKMSNMIYERCFPCTCSAINQSYLRVLKHLLECLCFFRTINALICASQPGSN